MYFLFSIVFEKLGIPFNDFLSAFHAVERASTAVCVGSHTGNAQPVPNFHLNRCIYIFCDDIHAIASHTKQSWVVGFINSTGFWCRRINFRVKLTGTVLKADPVHQVAVETVVKGFIQMVTVLSIFDSFSQDFCQQIKSITTEVPSWLGNYFIVQGVSLSDFEGIKCFLGEISRGETSADVENFHLVSVLSSYLHALPCKDDSPFEARRAVMSWTTMEVNASNVDSHLFYFCHSLVHFLGGVQVVSKLSWEGGGQVVAGIFFDGNSPKNLHLRGILLNLPQLINRVSCGQLDVVLGSPNQVVVVLDWVRIHEIRSFYSHFKKGLKLVPWSTVKVWPLLDQVLEQWNRRICLYRIMWFNPRQRLSPCSIFPLGLEWIVDECACLQIRILNQI